MARSRRDPIGNGSRSAQVNRLGAGLMLNGNMLGRKTRSPGTRPRDAAQNLTASDPVIRRP